MNASEADDLVRRIANAWGHQFSDDEAMAWRLALVPLPYGLGLAALDRLAGEPAMPSHRRVLEVALEAGERAKGRAGAPRPRRHCGLCGGTGWREAEVAGGPNVAAVVRCPCVVPADGKHASNCTCRRCMPTGGGEGPPAEPNRKGPDPLEFRGVKPAPGSLL